jgi:hypothetical protein
MCSTTVIDAVLNSLLCCLAATRRAACTLLPVAARMSGFAMEHGKIASGSPSSEASAEGCLATPP